MPIAGLRRLARSAGPTGAAAALGVLVLSGEAAQAGPPFRTDDPVPVERGHWEVFTFSTATHAASNTAGILSGIDANYGAAPGLQLHGTFPGVFDKPDHQRLTAGYGDTEFGFKYRFLAEDEAGWRPQAAIYPAIDLPTGNAARNLGAGHSRVFLPLWLQKGIGRWTTFVGAGYWVNPGIGNRNYWYLGWAVQHQITDNLTLGGELFHQTAAALIDRDQTGFDLGLTYDLSAHHHLLFSAGSGLQHRSATNACTYYAALQVTF